MVLLQLRIISPRHEGQLSQPHKKGWPFSRPQREERRADGQPTDLIDGQVDAGVGDDAQHVGQVAAVEGAGPFSLQDLPCAVQQPLVLAGPAKRQSRLQHLERTRLSLES